MAVDSNVLINELNREELPQQSIKKALPMATRSFLGYI
jgi:preprotein translocase subunit SecD